MKQNCGVEMRCPCASIIILLFPPGRRVSRILPLMTIGWVSKVISVEDNRAFHIICFQSPSRCRIIWKEAEKSCEYFLSWIVSTHFREEKACWFILVWHFCHFLWLSRWTSSQQSWKKYKKMEKIFQRWEKKKEGKRPEEEWELQ